MRTTLVTGPTIEPLTRKEVQDHLRANFAEENDYLDRLITAAREAFEKHIGWQLLTATLDGFLDSFPRFDREPVVIAKPPLQSVTTISYVDTAGASQTWDSSEYTVQAYAGASPERGVVYPNADQQYPDTRWIENAVTIRFVAGYTSAAAVPSEIKQALLAWIGHHYENRESVIVGAAATIVPALGFGPWIDNDFG